MPEVRDWVLRRPSREAGRESTRVRSWSSTAAARRSSSPSSTPPRGSGGSPRSPSGSAAATPPCTCAAGTTRRRATPATTSPTRRARAPRGGADRRGARGLVGVGHRVVHGGSRFTDVGRRRRHGAGRAPARSSSWRRCTCRPTCAASRPRATPCPALPHVAVFDTAFHQTHAAGRLPLRRPGGVVRRPRRPSLRLPRHQPPLRERPRRRAAGPSRSRTLRLVTLHLGNGCSAAAVARRRARSTPPWG